MPAARRPWGMAVLALLVLGPFFFGSYGLATWAASQRAHVGVVVFDWERHIPLLPWTIIPYWSIDVLYGLSLFVCRSRAELWTHVRRLLTVQAVAVTCFLLVPLRFSFERPALDGVPGALFAVLTGFDKPFNQAPSLHIALLVVLWAFYARRWPCWARWPLHGWFALIGVSVLTTWQHHFVDVPTGALLGFASLWAWPDAGPSPLACRIGGSPDVAGTSVSDRHAEDVARGGLRPETVISTDLGYSAPPGLRLVRCPRRRRLARRYALGAAALAGLACFGGAALWLLWPAVSLGMVALAYAATGERLFQKGVDGRLSLAAVGLLLPYLLAARLNTRLWPGDGRPHAPLCDGVSVGRLPATAGGFGTVVDLCAELPGPVGPGGGYVAVPMLDLVPPPPLRLREAARAVEAARRHGTVLVCCALGYSRSAAVAATWLLATGRAADVEAAVAQVARARPHLVLDAAARASIAAATA